MQWQKRSKITAAVTAFCSSIKTYAKRLVQSQALDRNYNFSSALIAHGNDNNPETPMSILLIVLLVLLLAGGGFGFSRFGAVGGGGIVGTILIIILVLYLLGALGTGHV
jgi:hypothetical protein